jgi:hypothetical protein
MNTQLFSELDKLKTVCRNAKDITPGTLDLYAEELADLPPEQVVAAIGELRKSQTFFPSLAEIRQRTVAIIAGPVLVDPEAAFGEVMRQIKLVGSYGTPQFSSPLVAKAVESLGGWKVVCLMDLDDLSSYRAQFRKALAAIQHREVDRIVSGRAIGEGLDALDAAAVPVLSEGFQPTTKPQPWREEVPA